MPAVALRLLGALAMVTGFVAATGVAGVIAAAVLTDELVVDVPLAAVTLVVAVVTTFVGAAALVHPAGR